MLYYYKATLFCCLVGVLMLWYHPTDAIESVFPDRSRPPGLNDCPKLWWAKQVTPDYHIAGRLSGRQIKYASEVGFKSIVSLYGYKVSDSFGGEYLPTATEAKKIAEDECGLEFADVLLTSEDWRSVRAIKKFSHFLLKLKKPVLLYSDKGREVTFVLLMHLANLTRHDPAFEPKVDSKIFYQMTAVMGMNFTESRSTWIVSQITGDKIVTDPPVTNVHSKDWLEYWLAHPVYKNWYSSGQIRKSYISVLVKAGFKNVVNLRTGEPHQEQVNLLNIKERTGTHDTTDTKLRQSKERLEETRVDPDKPNSYISLESNVNYESKNEAEFGDDVGYNEALEKAAFEGSKLIYNHYPAMASGQWASRLFDDVWKIVKIAKRGPIIIHRMAAAKATYVAITGAALQHNLDFNWALTKSRDLGFPITEKKTPEIYKSMKKLIQNGSSTIFLNPCLVSFLSIFLILSLYG